MEVVMRVLWVVPMLVVSVSIHAGSEMRSQSYRVTPAQAWQAANAACASHKWKIKESSQSDGVLVAKTKVSGLTWGAVMNINISETKEGVKIVVTASTTQWVDKKKLQKDLNRFFSAFEAALP